jgi:hypothetical protein
MGREGYFVAASEKVEKKPKQTAAMTMPTNKTLTLLITVFPLSLLLSEATP